MDKIKFAGRELAAGNIRLVQSNLLFIVAPAGVLGCGYFDTTTADKVGEALAVVTGVKSYDDMLAAAVVRCSAAAAARGVLPGMSGRDALLKLMD